MSLAPGSRLGVYEVTAQIGEGGMGQVYRATDTSLKRQVAIKVLPETLAADPDRLARFQREAEVLASLNHPNIAAIHGLERSGGVNALVMELVEGEDLSQRIVRGAIPLDEALPIAKQIAEALEAAHEQGIVHRDLKPANVKVRADGAVKVLDFGLAKAMETAEPKGSAPQAATITSPAMTQMGMILGTAAYMAPEQARGKIVDRRADIWAFGALLFEMLTGRRAFEGDDLSITLATVMMKEPEWSALPVATPSGIQRLMRRCLVKDPRQRIRDMGDVRLALDGAFEEEAAVGGSAQHLPPPVGATRAATLRRVAALVGVAIGAGALAAAGVWYSTRPPAPRVSRTTITGSGAAALMPRFGGEIAIAPDGSHVVYVGDQGRQIFARALDALEPRAIASGANLASPFVSPDGQWVGFVDGNTLLKKVAISGGPVVTVSTLDGGLSRGAAWLADDTIIVATGTIPLGLQRVPASGGVPTEVTRPDSARGEFDHLFPAALPGGRSVLFTITSKGGADASSIAVYDLDTNTQTTVMSGGSAAQFVPGQTGSRAGVGNGHLAFVVAGTLRAVPFDPIRRLVLGPAVPVVSRLISNPVVGAGVFAVAADGTLVYADEPGGASSFSDRVLTWVDRAGKEELIGVPPRMYTHVRASPDGTRLALTAGDEESDIWVWDLRRQALTRMTFDPATDTYPLWTPDSRRLIFTSQRAGAFNMWWQAADGSGTPERLTTHDRTQAPTALAPDGTLVFHQVTESMGRDLMAMAMDGSRKITGLLQTPAEERDAVLSPDGRWLAFGTDSSGRSEVYARPFPNTSAGQWQISTAGGKMPVWSRDGKELYFFADNGALMAVTVEAGATGWKAGQPFQLLGPGYDLGNGTAGRSYDVSADGKRFLMLRFPASGGVPPSIIVVQHFNEELKRVAPVK